MQRFSLGINCPSFVLVRWKIALPRRWVSVSGAPSGRYRFGGLGMVQM